MVECICLDDKNRPVEVPERYWVKDHDIYHITLVTKHPGQGGIKGCELYEKPLPIEHCAPYNFFRLDRFGFTKENFKLLIELMHECTKLDHVDVLALLEESNVKQVEYETV